MNKKVYIAISADILHQGHINLIDQASKLGNLTVGVLTDAAVASYKRYPLLDFDSRKEIISHIKGVKNVVAQNDIDYTQNLLELKPDYVVHGDDWTEGIQSYIRSQVIETLKVWGGQLVEIPYTRGVSIEKINAQICQEGTIPEIRRARLRQLLTSRVKTIEEIMEVTTKPIIFDGDTGGLIEHFVYNVKTLERLGVSAIIIEDKIGLKKNSLFGTEVEQTQDTVEHFSEKLAAGKRAVNTSDFMIIARIESLILKKGMEDAVCRAKAYIDL